MSGFNIIADDILKELGVKCTIKIFDTGSFNIELGETEKILLSSYDSFCAIVKNDIGSNQSNSEQLQSRSQSGKMTYVKSDVSLTILLSPFNEITEDSIITIDNIDYCVNPFNVVMDKLDIALYKIPLSIKK
jgi:hypothetical protein